MLVKFLSELMDKIGLIVNIFLTFVLASMSGFEFGESFVDLNFYHVRLSLRDFAPDLFEKFSGEMGV